MAISKSKQAVITQLKKEWRGGARWCAFKNLDGLCIKEIKCFSTYGQAAVFCEAKNGKYIEHTYKVCVITDLLKRLYWHFTKSKQKEQTKILKTALCERYPQLSFPMCIDHLTSIPIDVYFPIIWNRVINPLTDISQWMVTVEGGSNKIKFRSADYYPVLDYFMKCTSRISMTGIKEALKLEAKLRPAQVAMYLEIYCFYYHSRRSCYMLEKKIDVSKPFLLPVTYFAKYNSRQKRLEFFDGNLKRIVSGKIVGEMNLEFFDLIDLG